MDWKIIIGIVIVLVVLRVLRVGMLTWTLAWWAALYAGIRYGFTVPVPGSVVTLYMAIATFSLIAYVSSSRQRWEEVTAPIYRLVLEPRQRGLLLLILVLLPVLAAFNVYVGLKVPLEAPAFGRTVHPAPPDAITVHDKQIDLATADNPYRELEASDPDKFAEHVENGRRVYFQNCFYCHGDSMGGDGMYSHALDPIPTNFNDQGVLPILQESFLYWRISKGGPGMPEEGGPWDSAMPAWEDFLTEEEIWDVILFLYDFNDYRPRALAEHH